MNSFHVTDLDLFYGDNHALKSLSIDIKKQKIKASHPTKGTKGMLPRYHPHSELLKNSALVRCNGRSPPGIGRRSRANYTEPFPRGALSRRRPSLLRRYSVIFPINAK